jgi:hypothetical protein
MRAIININPASFIIRRTPMRLVSLALVGALIATPVMAQTGAYGKVTCSEHFACPTGVSTGTEIDTFVDQANACVHRYFSSVKNSYFDGSAGLTSEKCLVSIPNSIATANSPLTPTCCIVQLANSNNCAFQCTLDGN